MPRYLNHNDSVHVKLQGREESHIPSFRGIRRGRFSLDGNNLDFHDFNFSFDLNFSFNFCFSLGFRFGLSFGLFRFSFGLSFFSLSLSLLRLFSSFLGFRLLERNALATTRSIPILTNLRTRTRVRPNVFSAGITFHVLLSNSLLRFRGVVGFLLRLFCSFLVFL